VSRIALRPTVAADMAALDYPGHPYRIRFLTMTDGDAVIGVGGLVFRPDGTVWIAAVLKPAARKARLTLHRAGLTVLREARARGLTRLYAIADPSQPRSEAWLQRCGFAPTDMFESVPGGSGARQIWQWTA